MASSCSHPGALRIEAQGEATTLRVYAPPPSLRVQAERIRVMQWCTQCGSIGFDGAWIQPLRRVERAR
jgi:hypothetical protein